MFFLSFLLKVAFLIFSFLSPDLDFSSLFVPFYIFPPPFSFFLVFLLLFVKSIVRCCWFIFWRKFSLFSRLILDFSSLLVLCLNLFVPVFSSFFLICFPFCWSIGNSRALLAVDDLFLKKICFPFCWSNFNSHIRW